MEKKISRLLIEALEISVRRMYLVLMLMRKFWRRKKYYSLYYYIKSFLFVTDSSVAELFDRWRSKFFGARRRLAFVDGDTAE